MFERTGANGVGKVRCSGLSRGLWLLSVLVDAYMNLLKMLMILPYTCLGTLRDQIITHDQAENRALSLYREGQNDGVDANILDVHLGTILEYVKLSYLFERKESCELSLGEQQRLGILSLGTQQGFGIARLFFHKPWFCVLDECTNPTNVEEHLYRLARDLGITVITSIQCPVLIPFHSTKLRLVDGEGRWELRSIKQSVISLT